MLRFRIRYALAAASALVAVVACAGEGRGDPFSLVTVDDVAAMVGKPDVLVVDANPEDVFRQGHVPGARWYRSAPLAQLLPARKDRPVVFYCASPH